MVNKKFKMNEAVSDVVCELSYMLEGITNIMDMIRPSLKSSKWDDSALYVVRHVIEKMGKAATNVAMNAEVNYKEK